MREAVLEASGAEAARWSDIDGIVAQFSEPDADISYLSRVWLNRPEKSSDQAFDVARWAELGRIGARIPDRASVALGFAGSRGEGATAIIATEVQTGLQQVVGIWRNRRAEYGWEVPDAEISEAVADAFGRWEVWKLFGNPQGWELHLAQWSGRFGEKRVVGWPVARHGRMAPACRVYAGAITDGQVSHDGSGELGTQLGAANKRPLQLRDDRGQPLWILQKERPDAETPIEAAIAAVLSWTARLEALADNVGAEEEWDSTVTMLG